MAQLSSSAVMFSSAQQACSSEVAQRARRDGLGFWTASTTASTAAAAVSRCCYCYCWLLLVLLLVCLSCLLLLLLRVLAASCTSSRAATPLLPQAELLLLRSAPAGAPAALLLALLART